MAGPKSKQTIEIEQRRRILNEAYEVAATLAAVRYALDDLLFYARPIAYMGDGQFAEHIEIVPAGWLEAVTLKTDAWIRFRAAVHRAEKVLKPVKV